MVYSYECKECGHKQDYEFSMKEEKPKQIRCSECKVGLMKRIWNLQSIGFHIPYGWNEDSYKFDKSPSGKKHIY